MKLGLCWEKYFSGDHIFDHTGKKGYYVLSAARRCRLTK